MNIFPINTSYLHENISKFLCILKQNPDEYWGESHFLVELPDKWKYSLAVEDDNDLIGYIIASKKESSVHIHKFMISNNFQRRGIGTKLLQHFESLINNDSNFRISLFTSRFNGKAADFYKKNNFQVVDIHDDQITMVKDLKKIVSIHQPNFLPWIGYFNKILSSNIFVLFDNVQFPRGKTFGNRVLIKTNNGVLWLTAPVIDKSCLKSFNQIELNNKVNWQKKIANTLRFQYSKSKYFKQFYQEIEDLLYKHYDLLIELNVGFLQYILTYLKSSTCIQFSSSILFEYEDRGEIKIINVLKKLNATHYLSGTGAGSLKYINKKELISNNIELIWQHFEHPVYHQVWGDFIPKLSIVDLLFNMGPESRHLIIQNGTYSRDK